MSTTPASVRVDSPTEGRNPRTLEIDTASTLEVLELLNDEDARVAGAVRDALPQLAMAVDAAVASWEAGGTIHYFGAGTSGRIATLDAAELPPTYSIDPKRAVAHHAGGLEATRSSIEGVEDSEELGRVAAADVTSRDFAIGIAASGRTPFVRAALQAAQEVGAFTVAVSSAPNATIAEVADVHVFTDTGPEAVAGSTRLKAGTAHKMVLNDFSTAVMIRLGKTYSNLMVHMARANAKLRGRALTILEEASAASEADCATALDAADGRIPVALVMLLSDTDATAAADSLRATGGKVRSAVALLSSGEVPME